MTTLNEVFKFMHTGHRPHVHDAARQRIRALAEEMVATYIAHIRQSSGKLCDICGKGDQSEYRRVATVISGYEHREHDSPVLCFNHRNGWSATFNNAPEKVRISDEGIDLHFAMYVANQLIKLARRTACPEQSFTRARPSSITSRSLSLPSGTARTVKQEISSKHT